MSFEVVPGSPASPVVLHVPHASTAIPADVRRDIALGDEGLAAELAAMTDAGTDVLARAAADEAGERPWLFVNRLSRLVVDPERFPDEREVMEQVGMGAVYTRTSRRERLRAADAELREGLLTRFFHPYATALAELVDARLDATGRAAIIDVHSYPHEPLPYELHPHDERPEICIGTDDVHTPPWLRVAAAAAFGARWSVACDTAFRGTYVPLRHFGVDRRVVSVMLELRRDVYLHQDGSLQEIVVRRLAQATAELIDAAGNPSPSGTSEGTDEA
ncbi:MAG TPA: N-formylglutamate amidohydrolase [Baekduia sp.]|nr:N-formylglutamate amidohydrolase [Baekduia sp.]